MVSEENDMETTTNNMINKLNFDATLFRPMEFHPSEESVIRDANKSNNS
jgi:hypothetical protein